MKLPTVHMLSTVGRRRESRSSLSRGGVPVTPSLLFNFPSLLFDHSPTEAAGLISRQLGRTPSAVSLLWVAAESGASLLRTLRSGFSSWVGRAASTSRFRPRRGSFPVTFPGTPHHACGPGGETGLMPGQEQGRNGAENFVMMWVLRVRLSGASA